MLPLGDARLDQLGEVCGQRGKRMPAYYRVISITRPESTTTGRDHLLIGYWLSQMTDRFCERIETLDRCLGNYGIVELGIALYDGRDQTGRFRRKYSSTDLARHRGIGAERLLCLDDGSDGRVDRIRLPRDEIIRRREPGKRKEAGLVGVVAPPYVNVDLTETLGDCSLSAHRIGPESVNSPFLKRMRRGHAERNMTILHARLFHDLEIAFGIQASTAQYLLESEIRPFSGRQSQASQRVNVAAPSREIGANGQ